MTCASSVASSVARGRHHERHHDLVEEVVVLADHRDLSDARDRRDDVFDLAGRDVLAADLEQVLVALAVEEVAAGAEHDHVAGLEPVVLEGLRVGLVVVVVLEEELDPARAAQPQLAGLALGAQLAGLLVDHRELVPGRHMPIDRSGRCSEGLPFVAWMTVSVMPYAA